MISDKLITVKFNKRLDYGSIPTYKKLHVHTIHVYKTYTNEDYKYFTLIKNILKKDAFHPPLKFKLQELSNIVNKCIILTNK